MHGRARGGLEIPSALPVGEGQGEGGAFVRVIGVILTDLA